MMELPRKFKRGNFFAASPLGARKARFFHLYEFFLIKMLLRAKGNRQALRTLVFRLTSTSNGEKPTALVLPKGVRGGSLIALPIDESSRSGRLHHPPGS